MWATPWRFRQRIWHPTHCLFYVLPLSSLVCLSIQWLSISLRNGSPIIGILGAQHENLVYRTPRDAYCLIRHFAHVHCPIAFSATLPVSLSFSTWPSILLVAAPSHPLHGSLTLSVHPTSAFRRILLSLALDPVSFLWKFFFQPPLLAYPGDGHHVTRLNIFPIGQSEISISQLFRHQSYDSTFVLLPDQFVGIYIHYSLPIPLYIFRVLYISM